MIRWIFSQVLVQGELIVPATTLLDIPESEQDQMLKALRRARYGYLLALHVLLLCAAGRQPTEIAAFLLCSRSSVYRIVRAYRQGTLGLSVDAQGQLIAPIRTTVLMPWLKRALKALLHSTPRTHGWCRTRWSCESLAATLNVKHGLAVSAETLRRWLHEIGWVWKRAQLVAKDRDPNRISRLAHIRFQYERLCKREVLVFADELDIHLLPKVGAQWMPKGTRHEVMTPGQNEKHYLAGALNPLTGQLHTCLGPRKNNGLFRELLTLLDQIYPAPWTKRIYVVVDNYCIHKAKAVGKWLEAHPRFELLWLPTYCPQANPIERAFGDVHDKCTRNHQRKRLRDLIADVARHFQQNGPWRYKLSHLYHDPEVDVEVERLDAQRSRDMAA
jgi:putative transposase